MTSEPKTRVRRRRFLKITLSALVAMLLAWLLACFLVVQHPTINQVSHADAIVVLGPPEADRVAEARRLLAAGVSDQLVISVPAVGFRSAEDLCRAPVAGFTTTCFKPNPSTTRGEAEEMARLAAIHHWGTVVVVTSKFHVSRARMIFDRCLDGRVEVVNSQHTITVANWAYQYAYQTAGYARAFLHPSC